MKYSFILLCLALMLNSCKEKASVKVDTPTETKSTQTESKAQKTDTESKVLDEEALGNLGMKANPKGLKLGDKAPKFKGLDQNGNTQDLDALLEKGKVLLVFYRGQWCPLCAKHLSAFEDDLYKLKEKNITAIAVTPEKMENAKLMVEKSNLTVPVIQDPDHSIMKDYKVMFDVTDDYIAKVQEYLSVDLAEAHGDDKAVLPVPASYLIGQDGTIEFVHFDPNYKNRASVEMVLEGIN